MMLTIPIADAEAVSAASTTSALFTIVRPVEIWREGRELHE